jgi:hypothetical protein
MPSTQLRDDQWERIKDLFPGKITDCGVTAKGNRLFIKAVLWIAQTGSPLAFGRSSRYCAGAGPD